MAITQSSLPKLLKNWEGGRVFFEPLHGNNGDRLIELGAIHELKAAGLHLTNSPANADLIVMNGGAGLTDVWEHAFAKLSELSAAHLTTPLIILPSTIQCSDPNIMLSALQNRTAKAYVYCREENSLQRMSDIDFPPYVEIGIDHDMAFALLDAPLIQHLRSLPSKGYNLIVERADQEGVTGGQEFAVGNSSLKKYIPKSIKRHLKRLVYTKAGEKTPFAIAAKEFLSANESSLGKLPTFCFDASRPDLITFDKFCRLIAQSECVVSTRLHVGILAAMLRKKTYILGGLKKLGKINGIYEYSMREGPHVRMVSYSDNKITLLK